MGLLDKFFGSKVVYLLLLVGNEVLFKFDEVKVLLEELVYKVYDYLEVVLVEYEVFVFFGKFFMNFGMVWIYDGKVISFNDFVKEYYLL